MAAHSLRSVQAWHRRPKESAKAYAAFQHYLREGTIDAAYRAANPQYQNSTKAVPGFWKQWSTNYAWVARAAAYADHLAEQERLETEVRRREQRELEWQIAKLGLQIVLDALPTARQFLRSTRQLIPAQNGQPEREVVTISFDMAGLSAASERFGKQGRLATDEPTDHIQLSGAALDAYIARQLARIADGREAADGAAFDADEAGHDGFTAGGMAALPG